MRFLSCITFLFLFLTVSLIGQDTDLYDVDKVGDVRIKFKQDDWRAILDSLKNNGQDHLLADVTLNGKSYKNVGVRYRGNSSYRYSAKKNPLSIKLNLIHKDQNYDGYTRLILTNSTHDPSFVRQVLSFEIARKYMVAPQANFARVQINGFFEGVFVNIQPINSKFLEENFDSKKNTLVKCDPKVYSYRPDNCKDNAFSSLEYEEDPLCYTYNYEMKSDEGWDDLIELTRILNKEPKEIETILNVDQALWMHAFNNVFLNLSSYTGKLAHNYYLYQDNDGKFTPIIWDMNRCFGGFAYPDAGPAYSKKKLQEMTPLLHEKSSKRPLISQLLQNEQYKKRYMSFVRTLAYDELRSGTYMERAGELQRMIQVDVSNDRNNDFTFQNFQSNIKSTVRNKKEEVYGIEEMMDARQDFLRKKTSLTIVPPLVEPFDGPNLTFIQRDGKYLLRAKVTKRAEKVVLYYRMDGEKAFTALKMKDDGSQRDKVAGDEIFGAWLGRAGDFAGKTIEFYISAENGKAIGFSRGDFHKNPHVMTLTGN